MPSLESVTVIYKAIAAVADRADDEDFEPNIYPVTANVDLRYRTPPGWAFRAATYEPDPDGNPGVTDPTDIAIQSFTARLDEGQLVTLAGGPIKLVANTAMLAWPYGDLYVDVAFTNVVFNRGLQTWSNFAIKLPTAGGSTIDLTTVQRYPYLPVAKYADYFARLPKQS